ncbi:nitrous oxide reductase accessory protein NosL [Bacillus sp. FJAT-42315]|uniref:nitrous oxide reductase accessory protein NosL n=1 Tax=Bacillus sp. FJAT-42315 TaxID=2014077 RepID=UPI000C242E29|nr:nitrous oxide reductase accessory protein NosL [Bacillus sp. FJAT-42315]
MKKKLYILTAAAALSLAACSSNEKAEESKPETEEKAVTEQQAETTPTEEVKEETAHQHEEGEPTAETTCSFCDMKVYMKSEDMGQFTAKMVTEEGETLFFDDIGCMLNYERDTEKPAKERFVRDFNGLDWVSVDDAKIMKTEMKTPMNYGYAFFKDEESLNTFTTKHQNAQPATVEDIDQVANERYMKKKQMQEQEGDMQHGEGEHGEMKQEEEMQHEAH